jgi:hypothetical protein
MPSKLKLYRSLLLLTGLQQLDKPDHFQAAQPNTSVMSRTEENYVSPCSCITWYTEFNISIKWLQDQTGGWFCYWLHT